MVVLRLGSLGVVDEAAHGDNAYLWRGFKSAKDVALRKCGVIGNVSSARTTTRRCLNKRNSHCRNALNITLDNWCLRRCAEEKKKVK